MEKSSGNKSKKYSPLWLRLIINLAIMALVAFAIAWGAMCWLDVWTDHGNAVTVPQVKGLSYYDAENGSTLMICLLKWRILSTTTILHPVLCLSRIQK